MRVLIVHNQLWAHYKSKLFSEIDREMREKMPESELLVLQIALYESNRAGMQNDETVTYQYPCKVLFQRSLETIGFSERRQALFAAFNAFKPTVLNITGWADWAQILLMLYARSKGVKVVISSESSVMDHDRSALKEFAKGLIIKRANAFFCFGKTSVGYLRSLGVKPSQIPVERAAVVDETLIRERFEAAKKLHLPEPQIRKYIYVGRLAPEKNLDMLVRAFAKVNRKYPATLLFVGQGPEEAALRKVANELGVADKVTFTGGMPWYQVPEYLAKAEILILPSKSEPWGLVVNEAMVCGMPVIVSDKCGCADDLVQPGKNGFTFDPGQQTELEKAMRFFAENPDRILEMGAASSALIKSFSSKEVASKMVESFRRLSQ